MDFSWPFTGVATQAQRPAVILFSCSNSIAKRLRVCLPGVAHKYHVQKWSIALVRQTYCGKSWCAFSASYPKDPAILKLLRVAHSLRIVNSLRGVNRYPDPLAQMRLVHSLRIVNSLRVVNRYPDPSCADAISWILQAFSLSKNRP